MGQRIVIVGGVAAGASAAARARRLDESAEIVVFERGEHVSFATCGLPYHVGDVVPDEDSLLVVTPATFRERFGIDVRTGHEVLAVDRRTRTVVVRDLATGDVVHEPYDALVLATGARPIRPPVPGVDRPGVVSIRAMEDTRRLRALIDAGARRAVVVGAGFVGLEVAENLVHRGLDVTVLEMQPQVMPLVDPEMAAPVAAHLEEHGLRLVLGEALAAIEPDLTVRTSTGRALPADLVVLALGVRPETTLAEAAGLRIGERGGVSVDASMRTSDPHVWAVGDVIETPCIVSEAPKLLPLAGPASRQGRIAADAICGRSTRFRGVQGSFACGLFGLTLAATGLSEKELRRAGIPHAAVWLHPGQHVGWFPGASPLHLKLLYRPDDGAILGAQAVGRDGVEKRIDVIATAMQLGGTVEDLEQAELCYAPQYGAPKDPVNLAGMLACNQRRGDLPLARWEEVPPDAWLVDVREPGEFARGHVPGARSIPLSELRSRLDELPRDETLWIYCQSGKRSYDASRALVQHGLVVRSIAGGILSWHHVGWQPRIAHRATDPAPGA